MAALPECPTTALDASNLPVQGDIQTHRGMGERPDADAFDSGFRDSADGFQIHAAAGFELRGDGGTALLGDAFGPVTRAIACESPPPLPS